MIRILRSHKNFMKMNMSFNIFFYTYLDRFPLTYKDFLSDEEKRRCNKQVPRTALKPYFYSSFRYLLFSGNNQALLNVTEHDHSSFKLLLQMFHPYYNCYTWNYHLKKIRKKVLDKYRNPMRRKRDITAPGCLSLVLM